MTRSVRALAATAVALCVVTATSLDVAGATVTSVVTAGSCEDVSDEAMFCSLAVDYPVSASIGSSAAVLDVMAKQNFDAGLSQVVSCLGVYLTAQCASAYMAYTCANTFNQCEALNATHINVRRPCRSLCTDYCDACFVASCPCYDLPTGEGCFTVEAAGLLEPAVPDAAAGVTPRAAMAAVVVGATAVSVAWAFADIAGA